MYQKCPICDGAGSVSGGYFHRVGNYNQWASTSAVELCRVCKGTGIIDQITGLPPEFKESKEVKHE
jgi:RecJ-like exonuclease